MFVIFCLRLFNSNDNQNIDKVSKMVPKCLVAITTFTSMVLTVISIYKIFKTVNLMQQVDSVIRIDKYNFMLHILILSLLTASVTAYALPEIVQSNDNTEDLGPQLILCSTVLADLIYQTGICYICWSMGSSALLRKHELTIVCL